MRTLTKRLAAVATLALVCAACHDDDDDPPPPADPPPLKLIGTTSGLPSRAYNVNTKNGATVVLSAESMDGTIVGLAHDPAANKLYGVSTASPSTLFRVKLSGLSTEIGPLMVDDVFSLAWDSNTSTLYGVTQGPGTLVSIDTNTGLATTIGNLGGGYDDVVSSAYDPNGDVLYAYDETADQLISINTSTGAATLAAGIGIPGTFPGLGFDPATDTLYGYIENPSAPVIMSIDPVTGGTTSVGGMGSVEFPDVEGIAFDTSVDYIRGTRPMGGLNQGKSALIDVVMINSPQNAISVESTAFARIAGLTYDSVADTVYAVNNTTDMFMSMNRKTGETDPIGPTGFTDVRSLAFDPTPDPGTIWAVNVVDGGSDQLLTIDTFAGGGSIEATITDASADIEGLAWDDSTGLMYALVQFDGEPNTFLATIDTATGDLTVAAGTGLDLRGLTLHADKLYATSKVTRECVKLNKTTGAATVIGNTKVSIDGLADPHQ